MQIGTLSIYRRIYADVEFMNMSIYMIGVRMERFRCESRDICGPYMKHSEYDNFHTMITKQLYTSAVG